MMHSTNKNKECVDNSKTMHGNKKHCVKNSNANFKGKINEQALCKQIALNEALSCITYQALYTRAITKCCPTVCRCIEKRHGV